MRKRAQEEIVGFVVVVVLIAVIFLILLAFNLRTEETSRESVTLNHLLESVNEYTTTCSLSRAPDYARIGELYGACARELSCEDGTPSCTALNTTLANVLAIALPTGEDRPVRGYKVRSLRVNYGSQEEQVIMELRVGNCSGTSYYGVSDIRPAGGDIIRTQLTRCN